MIRAVLNANVLASALVRPAGPPGEVLRALDREKFELVVSEPVLAELSRTLSYPRLQRLHGLSADDLDVWVASVAAMAITVAPTMRIAAVQADPDDDKYVEAALEGRAAYIVSGDPHLLDLGRYDDVRVVTPRTFLDVIAQD